MRIGLRANVFLFVSTVLSMTIVLAPYGAQAAGRNQESPPSGGKSDPDAAISGCLNLMKLHPQDEPSWPARVTLAFFNCGNSYFAKGNFDRAIEEYSQAIKISPQFNIAFNNRGNVYLAKHDYDRAIEDYNEAIRIKSGYLIDNTPTPFDVAIIFENRGIAFADKHDYDRAIEDYSQAIRLKPRDADAFYTRGIAYGAEKDYDKAIADYDNALQIDPENASALYSRGIAKQNKDDIAGAQADQAAAVKIDPNIADKAGVREVTVSPAETDLGQTQFVPACSALPGGAAAVAEVRPYVDEPIGLLKGIVPGLNGIKANADEKANDSGAAGAPQDESTIILSKTGAAITGLLHTMPNLIAREEVRQPTAPQEIDGTGLEAARPISGGLGALRSGENEIPVDRSADNYDAHVFTYRIVHGENASGADVTKEFRTDSHDQPIDYSAHKISKPLNSGFATLWLFFLPDNLQESRFRYLGQQQLGDRKTYVLAFAQIPEYSGLDVLIDSSYGRCSAPLQGVAWIDQATFQIVRMQTDLLTALPDIQLNQLRSTLEYGPVKIHGLNRTLWLPNEVGISWQTALGYGQELHLYSHYRLFESSVTILPGSETAPQ